MKYCLTISSTMATLKKADEIKVKPNDWRYVPVVRADYPETAIILELNRDSNIENILNDLQNIKNIIYACDNLEQMTTCKKLNIPFYYKYTITNYSEAQALKQLGVCYFLIGVPLIFDLDRISSLGVPLRAMPNLAYEPYLEHSNGIRGGWIRPEDVEKYEKYITTLEFYLPNRAHTDFEETLYDIYAVKKEWNGNLNFLIENLNYDIDNRLIYNEDGFAERRMNCKQKCMINYNNCYFCEDRVLFGEKIAKFAKETKRANLT